MISKLAPLALLFMMATANAAPRSQTLGGSRTGLFVPELDRLLLAMRARGDEPAAVWIPRPAP